MSPAIAFLEILAPHRAMTPEQWTLAWAAVSAVASAAAAIYAAIQLRRSRLEPMRRATLEQISKIDDRLQPLLFHQPEEMRRAVIDCYKRNSKMTTEAAQYLAFLNALDTAAFAAEKEVIDGRMFAEHMRTLTTAELLPLSFLQELQDCCNDTSVYEHLRRFLQTHAPALRRRPHSGE